MAWTLADAIANEKDPLRKGVLQVFWLESNLMAALPWETYKKLRITVTRLNRLSLTKPGWVPMGSAYGEATPNFDTLQEEAMKLGRDIDTIREYAELEGEYEDLRALGAEAALKAIVYEYNEAVINGPNVNTDGSSNPNAIIGIRQRIEDLDGQQGLADVKLATEANGTLFGPTATSANANTVLDTLNRSIYFIDGHAPDWSFVNQTFLLALESQLRRNGLFATTRDQYERMVYVYRDVPFYDVGRKVDQSTAIIGDDEVQGTSADATSVFFGRNGIDTHFGGWEMSPLDVRDLGELQGSPLFRTRVDWVIGLGNWHPRALSRVVGIRAGT